MTSAFPSVEDSFEQLVRGFLNSSSSQLSEEDMLAIRRYITAVEGEVRSLEQLILHLQFQSCKRVNSLLDLRRALSPARRVPLEVLGEIYHWLFWLHQEENPNAVQVFIPWPADQRPWQATLLNICSLWRQAALGSHFLWRRITVSTPGHSSTQQAGQIWCKQLERRWMFNLTTTLQRTPRFGPVSVTVDLRKSGRNHRQACQMAVEYLYDPLLESGCRIPVEIGGFYNQITSIFYTQFKHPELLEHIILRDLGHQRMFREDAETDAFLLPALLHTRRDVETYAAFFQAAPKLCKLDLIAESGASILLDKWVAIESVIVMERITHLTIIHAFDTTGLGNDLAGVLSVPRVCKNLIYLKLAVHLPNDWDDDDWNIEPEEYLELPFLETLLVRFDMCQFFRHLIVPSLSHLEIWNLGHHPLHHIPHLVTQSRCSIKTFTEIRTTEQLSPKAFGQITERWQTTQTDFEAFLSSLRHATVFSTVTVLSKQDLEEIASGRFLPKVKVLQFYTNIAIDQVTAILRPRFRKSASPSNLPASLHELVVNYADQTNLVPDFESDGTTVKTAFYGRELFRAKLED